MKWIVRLRILAGGTWLPVERLSRMCLFRRIHLTRYPFAIRTFGAHTSPNRLRNTRKLRSASMLYECVLTFRCSGGRTEAHLLRCCSGWSTTADLTKSKLANTHAQLLHVSLLLLGLSSGAKSNTRSRADGLRAHNARVRVRLCRADLSLYRGGLGLWVVTQLCDSFSLLTSLAFGSVEIESCRINLLCSKLLLCAQNVGLARCGTTSGGLASC